MGTDGREVRSINIAMAVTGSMKRSEEVRAAIATSKRKTEARIGV